MSSLLTLYRELRHRGGYGVHSPYAFMLVTEVLRLPAGYSYYDEKNESAAFDRPYRRLNMALVRYRWRFKDAKTNIIHCSDTCHNDVLAQCSAGTAAVAVLSPSEQLVSDIKAGMDTGVLFFGRKALIFFPASKVRFVAYEYRF